MLSGKGFLLWQLIYCSGGDPQKIADLAQQAGLSHVEIKLHDGYFNYNISADIPAIIAALRSVNVSVWGWGYIYGVSPEREAAKAVERILEFNVDGYVIDAEKEFKGLGMDAVADRFCRTFKEYLPNLPLGLSSYRFPELHREFPWDVFRSCVDFDMPQVYWEGAHNPGDQLKQSVDEFSRLQPDLPYYPVGSAYKRGSWTPTPEDMIKFMDVAVALEIPAVTFWSWQHTRTIPEVWDAIADYAYPTTTPPPQPPPQVEQQYEIVNCTWLNGRSSPNSATDNRVVVGKAGTVVDGLGEQQEYGFIKVHLEVDCWMYNKYLREL